MHFLPDTNIWLALTLSGHPHNGAAMSWFDGLGDNDVADFCRATQQSLLRLLTTRALFSSLQAEPLTNEEAWSVVDALLTDERIEITPLEPTRLTEFWRRYSTLTTPSPKRWMDAYLAAFARAAGARLVTNDRAFADFEELDALIIVAET